MRRIIVAFLLVGLSSAYGQVSAIPKNAPSHSSELNLEIFDLTEQIQQLKADNEDMKRQLQLQNDSIEQLQQEVRELQYAPPSHY